MPVMPLPTCLCGRVFEKAPGLYTEQRCRVCGRVGDFFVDDPTCPVDEYVDPVDSDVGPTMEDW